MQKGHKKIVLDELIKSIEDLGRKRSFQCIAKGKYDLSFDVAGTVYSLVKE